MNALYINYGGMPKTRKITNFIIGGYLAVFSLYFCIIEAIETRYSALFFCALIGFVLALILLLSSAISKPTSSLMIDNSVVDANLPQQKKLFIDWTGVSRVNIGVSYIVFLTNGEQKERKLDISQLLYNDVIAVKGKIIELCEHKNIPYHND